MEKDEVLKKSRNSKQDEGKEFAEIQAIRFGLVLFATVAGIIAIFCVVQQDIKSFCLTMGLMLTFAASISFGRFYCAGKKLYIIGIIVCAIVAISLLVNFFLISLR